MRDILHLTKWEFYKLIKGKLARILLGILVIIMVGITVNEYNQAQAAQEENISAANEAFDEKWREREELLIEQTKDYMEDPYFSPIQKEAIQKRIEIAKYKLEHNIYRNIYKDTWYFFSDNMFKGVSLILTLFVAIVGAFCVAAEYSDRTLIQLLLLPYKRYKVLTAKLLAVFMYAIVSVLVLIALGTISGLVVYGIGGSAHQIILSGVNGPYVLSSFTYSVIVVLLKLVEIALMVFLAVMIAILTKSSAIATIITSLMLILFKPLSIFAAGYGSAVWNFTPFINSDLRKYLEFGSVMPSIESYFTNNVVQGMNWFYSLMIVIVYSVIFCGISYYIFCKEDVR